jgi:hypothetical protein
VRRGYGTQGDNGVTDLGNEPAVYTALPDVWADRNFPDAFLSPSQVDRRPPLNF